MKICDNLYERLYAIDNLRLAYRKAKKGKSNRWYVIKFEENLDSELLQLKHELETHIYKPNPLKRFIIRDPKTRVIHASHFRDRVIHHAICNILEPIYDKTFIYDSYANRKNKGALAAINRFDCFKRKVSENGKLVKNAKNDNMIIGYVLKADIKHYFSEINHEILINIFQRNITDKQMLDLIRKTLEIDSSGKGMPLGNMTSQFYANVYLNELDHFVKHRLKAKYYIRYVDDFVILHKDKEVLADWKNKINEFLKVKLKIELHKEKSQAYSLCMGIDLLGFRVFYYHRLLAKKNIRRMKARMEVFRKVYENKQISSDKIVKSIEGWNAYAIWANTYKLRKRLIIKFSTAVP